jgi:uncharacterized Tic20 family protein
MEDSQTPPSSPAAGAGSSSDKLLIVLSHVSPFLGVGIILPLIIWLVKKGESEPVADHAKEALNFHLSVLIYAIGCWLLMFVLIGIVLLPLLGLTAMVLAIIGAVKSANGERYRYPYILRLVK